MIQFVSITVFRQALDALLKVKRGVVIRHRNLYPRFYSLLRRSPRISKMQFVNEMQKAL